MRRCLLRGAAQCLVQGKSRDARRFPSHHEVLSYLEAFAERFQLGDHVRLRTRVTSAVPQISRNGSSDAPCTWLVTTEPSGEGADRGSQNGATDAAARTEEFDALVVCNGHYAVPRLPPMAGVDEFSGRCEHSHNYRRPEGYAGQRVVVIGAHASGVTSAVASAR